MLLGFLPTSSYANTLNFRLTARDSHAGGGGVAHDDTTLTLAKTAGPFRVTSQATAASVDAGAPVTVTWSVAGTNEAPVNAANVKITLLTDGGQTFPATVLASTPNDGAQVVRLPNADTAQARIKVEAVGNVFFDVNRASFTIVPGAPVVSDDAAAAGAAVQYSDAPADTITISASDENSPGSALTATATGLPAGLALLTGATSPGGRTWTVGGVAAAAPGTYPVEVAVDDGTDHIGITSFDIVVSAEDALATYTGDALVTGAPGAAQAPARLSFDVLDSAAAPAAIDLSAGDVANATVTFQEGTTTLCASVPVLTAASATTGTATCTVDLATGSTHRVDAVIGGRYAGSGAGDVEIRKTDASTPPPPAPPAGPPPPPAAPPPPTAPSVALLVPDLGRVPTRLRVSKGGRVSIGLRCRTIGTGTRPVTCVGTLRLTARINGKRQTIGSATFSFPRAASKTVSVRLSAKARRALRKVTRATLTATATSAGRAPRKATKNVRLIPPKR